MEHSISNVKRCSKCERDLSVDKFYASKVSKDGLISQCKECVRKYQSTPTARARQRALKKTAKHKAVRLARERTPKFKAARSVRQNTPQHKAYQQAYYSTPQYKATAKARRAVPENRISLLAGEARKRADRFDVPFDGSFITEISEVFCCPVLVKPLIYEAKNGRVTALSPSLDRIKPALGYVPGNVQLISEHANRIKTNATPDEISAVAYHECGHVPLPDLFRMMDGEIQRGLDRPFADAMRWAGWHEQQQRDYHRYVASR